MKFAQLSVFSAMLVCIWSGCGDPSVGSSDPALLTELDSLRSTGQHGHLVVEYVVGRFRVSRLKKPVFMISVEKFDERLLDVPLRLTLLDSSSYQLGYELNRTKRTVTGTLDEMLTTDELGFVVSIADDKLRRQWKQLSYMEYEFRIYSF